MDYFRIIFFFGKLCDNVTRSVTKRSDMLCDDLKPSIDMGFPGDSKLIYESNKITDNSFSSLKVHHLRFLSHFVYLFHRYFIFLFSNISISDSRHRSENVYGSKIEMVSDRSRNPNLYRWHKYYIEDFVTSQV